MTLMISLQPFLALKAVVYIELNPLKSSWKKFRIFFFLSLQCFFLLLLLKLVQLCPYI